MITVNILGLVQLGFILVLYTFWFFTKYHTNIKIQIADQNSVKKRKTRDGNKLSIMVLWTRAFFSDPNMVQISFQAVFGIISFWEVGFIGFQLLMLFNLVDTMKTVVRSFTTHFNQLINIFIFAFLILVSVALISVIYYNHLWDEGVLGPVALRLCNNMFSCWLQVIDVGMRLGGSLADS